MEELRCARLSMSRVASHKEFGRRASKGNIRKRRGVGALVLGIAVLSSVPQLAACTQKFAAANRFSSRRAMHLPVQQYANVVAWSPDSQLIAASDQRGHFAYVWNANSGQLVFRVPNNAGVRGGLTFTADGNFLLGSATDTHGKVAFTIWDAHTGTRVRDVDGPGDPSKIGSSNAQLILRSPDRKHIVVIFAGGSAYGVYDSRSWHLDRVVVDKVGLITSAAISPDGAQLALGSYSGRVLFWHLPEGTKLREFQAEPNRFGRVFALAFNPYGKQVAIGSEVNTGIDDHQLRIWNIAPPELVRALKTRRDQGIYSVSYSPDGNFLATVSPPSLVEVWDVNSGSIVAEFSESAVSMAAFSPDGRKLAFAGAGEVTVIPVAFGGQ